MKAFGKALAALALAGTAAHAQVLSTNLLSATTFDSAAPSSGTYGYFYSNNGLGTQQATSQYFAPEDVDMTNAIQRLTFDITDLAGATGWGTGTGGNLYWIGDPGEFLSGDRADYTLTFDAKAEGLAEGQTAANGQMEFRIDVEREDLSTGRFQVNFPFNPTGEWKTYRFNLADGALASGGSNPPNIDDAEFALRHGNVRSLSFNVNFHEPFNQFGYDADNAFMLDNVKLEVLQRAPIVVKPTYPVNIVDWNFDDKPVWYDYNYRWSQNDNLPTFSTTRAANDLGTDGSVGWALQMDTSTFVDNTPQWAGGGMGAGGPANYAEFTSGDLADYVVSFDAKGLGVTEGMTTDGALQVFLRTPDNVILPEDDNTDGDLVVQLNFPIAGVGPEFKHYSFKLSKGGLGGGSKENFPTYASQIDTIQTQFQLENATSQAWGFDADNALVIDNLRIDRIAVDQLPIAFVKEGNEIVLNWTAPATGTTTLQAAADVSGPYTDVADATSGYRATINGNRFVRLSWTPPAGQ
jgi:hypothetical protein